MYPIGTYPARRVAAMKIDPRTPSVADRIRERMRRKAEHGAK
jgi:hypothetical protein